MSVDIGIDRCGGAELQLCVVEGERPVPLHSRGGIGIHGIAIRVRRRDVDPLGRQSQIEGLGSGAHGKQKSALLDEVGDGHGNGALLCRDRGEAQRPSHRPVPLDHVHQPGRARIVQKELGVLAGEVLMVQVQPVVGLQLLAQDLGVPHLLELYAGIVERHGNGVIPRGGIRRRVDRHLRRLLQRHGIHVSALKPTADLHQLTIIERLHHHPGQRRVAGDAGVAGEQERTATVVEEPLCLNTPLEGPIGKPIRLKVIRLGVVHGHQQPGGDGA